MLRLRPFAGRALPLLILLALYWPGLTNWFYQDDFGWLNLRRDVHSLGDLAPALFAPKAHGNMRPLGENAYFLVLSWLFGVDALPFRICAFATQMASLVLLGSIAARLTGSRIAAFSAQIFWMANTGLAAAMCWTSIYNQLLSAFFFLLAFWFFLRQIKSGALRDAVGHWIAFLLGLGALETNVVSPAVAAVYALLFARPYLSKILPMFAVSALAILVHFHFAPPPGGVYALHWDSRIFGTLWTYWNWTLGPSRWARLVLTGATAGLLLWKIRERQWTGAFGIAWFVIVLAPYLPLRDHKMDYYLTVPAIGVAIFGAWAMACAWRSAWVWKTAAVALVAIYLGTCVPAAWAIACWNHARGVRVEDVVLGVAEIHQTQPGKIILLEHVDSDLFWSGIVDLPFRAMEIPQVYLAPGSETDIQAPAALASKYTLPQALVLPALQEDRAVVYRVEGATLSNVTSRYRAMAQAFWKPGMPRFLNLGDSTFSNYLGAGWDAGSHGYRTLRRAAAVRMGGPRTSAERLYIGVFQTSPFHLAVHIDGAEAPVGDVRRNGELTELGVSLPSAMVGKEAIEIQLTNAQAEPLRFGYLEIR